LRREAYIQLRKTAGIALPANSTTTIDTANEFQIQLPGRRKVVLDLACATLEQTAAVATTVLAYDILSIFNADPSGTNKVSLPVYSRVLLPFVNPGQNYLKWDLQRAVEFQWDDTSQGEGLSGRISKMQIRAQAVLQNATGLQQNFTLSIQTRWHYEDVE
jgi:hypothetical protein